MIVVVVFKAGLSLIIVQIVFSPTEFETVIYNIRSAIRSLTK